MLLWRSAVFSYIYQVFHASSRNFSIATVQINVHSFRVSCRGRELFAQVSLMSTSASKGSFAGNEHRSKHVSSISCDPVLWQDLLEVWAYQSKPTKFVVPWTVESLLLALASNGLCHRKDIVFPSDACNISLRDERNDNERERICINYSIYLGYISWKWHAKEKTGEVCRSRKGGLARWTRHPHLWAALRSHWPTQSAVVFGVAIDLEHLVLCKCLATMDCQSSFWPVLEAEVCQVEVGGSDEKKL